MGLNSCGDMMQGNFGRGCALPAAAAAKRAGAGGPSQHGTVSKETYQCKRDLKLTLGVAQAAQDSGKVGGLWGVGGEAAAGSSSTGSSCAGLTSSQQTVLRTGAASGVSQFVGDFTHEQQMVLRTGAASARCLTSVKRDLLYGQKRPIIGAKETY